MNTQDYITIRGAREHNLKDVNLTLPKNKLIVFSGVSGSGKSSLAFDTLYAEGQRRFIESLSSYARQFLGQKEKPDVDGIEGIMPAISIDQKGVGHNPRSTVATITEIYDYLRVLFARVGQPHCPKCGRKIEKMSVDEIVDYILSAVKESSTGQKLTILAPLVRGRKGEYHQLLYDLYAEGYSQVVIDGKPSFLGERISLARYRAHTIDLVVDEFALDQAIPQTRLVEAVEAALNKGNKVVKLILSSVDNPRGLVHEISTSFTCPNCNTSFPEIEPRLFSFNSPYGACPRCHGLGVEYFWSDQPCSLCDGKRLRAEALAVTVGDKNIVAVTDLTIEDASQFFAGLKLSATKKIIADQVIREINNRLTFLRDVGLEYIALGRRAETLSGGEAQRIRLASQIGTQLTGVLYVLDEPTIGLHQRDNERLVKTLERLRDLGNTVIVVEHDEATILSSDYLVDIGPSAGVNGGQIITAGPTRLLLNPKIKSHPEIVGDPSCSKTIDYLVGRARIDLPKKRRSAKPGRLISVIGAQEHNLKNIAVDFPLGLMTVVTGVSGSGKSTLVNDILARGLQTILLKTDHRPGRFKEIKGNHLVDKVILVDQSPIGRTPRSNPATYTGMFTPIRDLYAQLPAARERAYLPGRFSFNVSTARGGGRCEACEGDGYQTIEMHFLPDVFVACEVCQGKRFSQETLEVEYKSKNIAQVLNMTVEEAAEFFAPIPRVADKLLTLKEVGLGYVKLGQTAPTLSGGEAQRVKLSTELAKRSTGRTIYILDEPTVGLHFDDVKQLLQVLQTLVNKGNSVIMIEHNLDVIKQADWVIDLGPEGGDKGGRIISAGPPETIARNVKSHTGRWLKTVL